MHVSTTTIGAPDSAGPDFDTAIRAVSAMASSRGSSATTAEQEALREIGVRLERLRSIYAELMTMNEQFDLFPSLKVEFDQDSGLLVFRLGDQEMRLQLTSADPSKPIQVRTLDAGGAYLAGSEPIDDKEARLRVEFETKLEAFYQGAHRILKLLAKISGLPSIRCEAITMIRNQLIEHPAGEQFYSFGFGRTGPRVKPMHRGSPAWNDEGLLPNAAAFTKALIDGLRSRV